MSFIPKPQEIYKHFKGNLYQIVTVAEHTETGQQLVIYQAMYGDFKTYARDLEMFTSRVDREKYPDVTQEFRFELQGPDSGRQRQEGGSESGKQSRETEPESSSARVAQLPPVSQAEAAPKAEPVSRVRPENQVEPAATSAAAPEPSGLDPMVEEFLDTDSYEEKLNILAGLHHRITQDMITTMAVASDIEVEEGELEERYLQLKNCLLMLEKYECKRLD